MLHVADLLAASGAVLADVGALGAGVLVCAVPISMKCAEVRQISAQASIRRKCSGSTCLPPAGRQWFEAMPRQVW